MNSIKWDLKDKMKNMNDMTFKNHNHKEMGTKTTNHSQFQLNVWLRISKEQNL